MNDKMFNAGSKIENMTIEGFFLKRYREMELENENLKTKLRAYENAQPDSAFGIKLGDKIDMVKIEVASYYSLDSGIFKDKDSKWVEEKKDDIDNAENWSIGYRNAITVNRETFPYTFEVVYPNIRKRYGVDSRGEVINIGYSTTPEVGDWIPSSYEDKAMSIAKSDLLSAMDTRIEILRDKEEKQDEV